MAYENGTVAQRLRQTIDETPGMSVRRLSRLIAERSNVAPESARRAISKWLAGDPIGTRNARLLSQILGKPEGYFMSQGLGGRVRQLEEQLDDARGRLEAVEAEVAELRAERAELLPAVLARLGRLEDAASTRAPQRDRRSTGKPSAR